MVSAQTLSGTRSSNRTSTSTAKSGAAGNRKSLQTSWTALLSASRDS